ncbi:MAG: 6-hydroxymethylpterin diphosphokinase MptE-like protein [Candidatus Desantisbacteria bacterium]
MSYFESNMSLLKQKDLRLFNRVNETEAKELPYPEVEGMVVSPHVNLDKINILAILGFGYSLHINELLQKTGEKTFLLIIDHDIGCFKSILSKFNLAPILTSHRVTLSIEEDPSQAVRHRIDQYYRVSTIPDIMIVEYKPATSQNPEFYQQVRKYLSEATLIATQNLATLAEHAPVWQSHILMNLPQIISSPGLKELFEKFEGFPAIIVAAGPSLDKNVALLKEAKGKAMILCVDTALRTVLQHGIQPDFVVAIDATEKNYKYYLKPVTIPEGTYLLTGPAVYPDALPLFSPNIFFSGFGHPWLVWIETFIGERGAIKLGGSVSTAGFDLAVRFGANPVIFIGQDLSFPDNKVYTQGVLQERIEEAEEYAKKLNTIWIEDIYGNQVPTTQSMWTWVRWFEYQIQQRPDITYIDATEGGAKIMGTKILTLRETIDEYCQRDISIKKVLDATRDSYNIPPVLNLIEEMGGIVKDWSRVMMLCKEGQRLSERLQEAITPQISKRALKLWREIGHLYQRILEHRGLFHLGSWNLESLLFRMEKALQTGDAAIRVQSYQAFFEEVGEYCRYSCIDIQKAQEKISEGNRVVRS